MVFKLLLIILIFIPINSKEKSIDTITYVSNEITDIMFMPLEIENKLERVIPVIKTYTGPMTAYGPDCIGCSGITASGYNVLHNIYYNDKTFGKVRILAADKSLPFGTIIRIHGLKNMDEILAIVLDRGSAIGFNKRSYFDLLYQSERETETFGCQNATYEVLRFGY